MQGDESQDSGRLPFDDGTMPSLVKIGSADLADSSLNLEVQSDRMERALIGQIIDDKFRISDILGKGGMSIVYKAQWVVLNKTVAVKTMHSHLVSDTNALMRFKQEAQATIQLEHPHVVKVYQFGITGGDDSKPYIVMDYIEGESLSERLKRKKRLPVREALQIFIQVCNALDHAHKKGVIHRDLKPSNIMLLHKEGELPNIKIVDFGIAKLLPQEGEQAHRLTQTGDIFGSPMYMSPEQCMGRTVDIRSDIYAIGCVLYESLHGMPPHMGNNVFETFHKHISEIPASLSIPDTDKALINRLDAVVFRALEKEPDKRFQSMAEFEAAIQSVQDDLDKGLRGTNLKMGIARQQRSLKRFVNSAPKVALIATLCLLLISGAVAFGWSKCSWFFQSHTFVAPPTHWLDYMPDRRKKEKLTEEEKRARLDQGMIAGHFSLLNHDQNSLHRAEVMKEKARICAEIDAPKEEIEARSEVVRILESREMDNDLAYVQQIELFAECLLNQGNLYVAKDYLTKAALMRETLRLDNNTKLRILLGHLYEIFAEKSKVPSDRTKYARIALTQLDEAQAMLSEHQSSADSRRSAVVYAMAGDSYRLLGDMKQAERNYELAQTVLSASGSEKHKTMLRELSLVRSYVNLELHNYAEARKFYVKAMPYAKSRFEHDTEQLQQFLDGYAFASWNSGDIIQAIQLRDRSVDSGSPGI